MQVAFLAVLILALLGFAGACCYAVSRLFDRP
jgi:hypothetical protein